MSHALYTDNEVLTFNMHVHVRVPSDPYMWILEGTQHVVQLKTVSKRTPSIIDNFDTILYMYVAVLLVFDLTEVRSV